jgi:hypothetical protein
LYLLVRSHFAQRQEQRFGFEEQRLAQREVSKQVDEVWVKADRIIEGQQQLGQTVATSNQVAGLMTAISVLSEQIARQGQQIMSSQGEIASRQSRVDDLPGAKVLSPGRVAIYSPVRLVSTEEVAPPTVASSATVAPTPPTVPTASVATIKSAPIIIVKPGWVRELQNAGARTIRLPVLLSDASARVTESIDSDTVLIISARTGFVPQPIGDISSFDIYEGTEGEYWEYDLRKKAPNQYLGRARYMVVRLKHGHSSTQFSVRAN